MTATSEQEHPVRSYLQMIEDSYVELCLRQNQTPIFERSAMHTLLRQGRPMFLPDPVEKVRQGTQQECFRNAYLLSLHHHDYVYCEGYAVAAVLPVEHAWCVRRSDGAVVDPTWQRFIRSRKMRPQEFHYFGIALSHRFVTRTILKNGVYGIMVWPSWRGVPADQGWKEDLYEM